MDPAKPQTLIIKKYPNRRFYDATRSQHVTLEEMYHLIRQGHQIQVTDSEGNNITNVVLCQILLEHDPPKLGLFPPALFHQAIQANQQMFRSFVEDYFAKAMDAFVQSRQQFDSFLQQAGLSPMTATTPFDWAQRFFRGFSGLESSTPQAHNEESEPAASAVPGQVDLLRAELDQMREELQRLQNAPARRKKTAKRASAKKSKTGKKPANRPKRTG